MPHPKPYWLEGKREKRRRLKDIKRFIRPDVVYEMIVDGRLWPYLTNKPFYEKRDKALLALLYLTTGRINEVLKITKGQFDFEADPEFVVIKDFEISKRKEATIKREGVPKVDLPLPKVGTLSKFTDLVLDYYEISSEEMFRIGRVRAWAIVKYMTGKWCHFFRSQKLSYLVNLFHSALVTSKIVGIKNPQTIAHYYKTAWEEHRDKLKS